jgi:YcxB-like protein
MRVTFKPTTGDYAAALAQISASQVRPRGAARIAVWVLISLTFASLLLGLMVLLRSATGMHPPLRSHVQLGLSLIAGALIIGFPVTTWFARRLALAEQRLRTADPLTEQTIEITPDGLSVETVDESSIRRWSSILKFVDAGHHLFIFLAPNAALFIPVSAFPSAVEFRQFATELSAYVQRADA